jgi:hypothetical protein
VGVYRSDELGTEYRIVLEEDGQPRVHHRKLEAMVLIPAFRDAFQVNGASAEFSRDASGRVTGFRLSDGRVWNVRFERVEGL